MTNQTTNKKLLDQVRDTLCIKHYALSTEESYLLWIKRYIFFHKTKQGFVHPKDIGSAEIETFHALSCLVIASAAKQSPRRLEGDCFILRSDR